MPNCRAREANRRRWRAIATDASRCCRAVEGLRGGLRTYLCTCLSVRYFESVPGTLKHDGQQNPATWMLNVIADQDIDFPAHFGQSDLNRGHTAELDHLREPAGETLAAGKRYAAPPGKQLKLLFRKWFRVHWRTPTYNFTRTMICIIIALVVGSIFFRINPVDMQSMFSIAGVQVVDMLLV